MKALVLALLAALLLLASPADARARHHYHRHHRHHHHHRVVTAVTPRQFMDALAHTQPIIDNPLEAALSQIFAAVPITPVAHAVANLPRGKVFGMVAASAKSLAVSVKIAVAVTIKEGASCVMIGRAGERGPMQVLPATAAAMGLHPHTCGEWVSAGMEYLKQVLDVQGRYGLRTALSAYNHGWGRVYPTSYGGDVLRIMASLQ